MLAEIFGPDLLIVILVIVVLIFGGAAIPKLARNLGSAQGEFKKGLAETKGANAAADVDAKPSSNGTKSTIDVPSNADPEGPATSTN
jgi:sec-independent protein translocase protein TatA